MKTRAQKKLKLSRETLQSLAEPSLREAAGAHSDSCPQLCGSGANTACFYTCLCTTPIVCE